MRISAAVPRDLLAQWAAGKPTIKALYVFGSRAVGTAHTCSDLDLAFEFVDVDEPLAELVHNATCWKAELAQITGLAVKDLYLSTDRVAQGPRELVFCRQ